MKSSVEKLYPEVRRLFEDYETNHFSDLITVLDRKILIAKNKGDSSKYDYYASIFLKYLDQEDDNTYRVSDLKKYLKSSTETLYLLYQDGMITTDQFVKHFKYENIRNISSKTNFSDYDNYQLSDFNFIELITLNKLGDCGSLLMKRNDYLPDDRNTVLKIYVQYMTAICYCENNDHPSALEEIENAISWKDKIATLVYLRSEYSYSTWFMTDEDVSQLYRNLYLVKVYVEFLSGNSKRSKKTIKKLTKPLFYSYCYNDHLESLPKELFQDFILFEASLLLEEYCHGLLLLKNILKKTEENSNINLVDTYFILSNLYNLSGDFANGLKYADEALIKNPESNWAYAIKAEANIGLNKFDKALQDCDKALKIDSTSEMAAITFKNRGVVYLKQKKYYQAIENLNKSLTLSSKVEETPYYLALALKEAGKYDKAIMFFRRASRRHDLSDRTQGNRF